MYVQVTTEYDVDEELIIEQNYDEWLAVGASYGHNPIEFIEHLLDANVITADDLGEAVYRFIAVI